jgi:hypothetical protein
MTILQISKLEEFEERHPGVCRQMEAMFKAFLPLHVVAAVIQAQYGEHLCRSYLREYRWECRRAWRLRTQARQWAEAR